jgi:hypothetical protein
VPSAASGRYRVTASNVAGTLRDTDGNVVLPEVYVRSWGDLAGTYQGLLRNIAAPAADSATDLCYPGRVTITVSPTGSFSGSIDYQGVTYALAGGVDPVTGSASLSVARGTLPALDFVLRLTPADLENLTLSVASSELLRQPDATRVPWLEQSALSPIALKSTSTLRRAVGASSSVAGRVFSTVFKGSTVTDNTAGGYAIFTVSSSGLVSMAGRLGDGADHTTPVSNSTHLSADNIASVYRALYGIGHLAGDVQLRVPAPGDADNNAVVATGGDLEWKNPGIVSSITVTFQGAGYTLPPAIIISGGSGFAAQASGVLSSGRVIIINVINPGYGYSTRPTVSVIKSAAQITSSTFKQATAVASFVPRFARKLTPYGTPFTAPTSIETVTAAEMLGTASESTLSLRAFASAGDIFSQTLPAGTWGLNDASIIKPTTSLVAAWNTSGGTQENAAAATISLLSITPSLASPLRTLSFRSTTGATTVTLSPLGVVLQNDITSGGVTLPKGIYGALSRDGALWTEWCVR